MWKGIFTLHSLGYERQNGLLHAPRLNLSPRAACQFDGAMPCDSTRTSASAVREGERVDNSLENMIVQAAISLASSA
jgi:hypothetical protein